MDEHDLTDALRLAIEPPGSVNVDALRELARDADADDWDITTTAAHLGVSAHTLRYYERAGLLRAPRDELGHRRYDPASIRRLVFVTRMRTSGMGVSDLKHYVDLVDAGEQTIPERLDIMLEHRDTLHRQIAQLQLALAATEFKITTYTEGPTP